MSGNLISGTQRLFHTWTKGERKNATDVMRIGGLVPLSRLEEESRDQEEVIANSKKGKGPRKSLNIDLRLAGSATSPLSSPSRLPTGTAPPSPFATLFGHSLDIPGGAPPTPLASRLQVEPCRQEISDPDAGNIALTQAGATDTLSLEARRRAKPLPGRPRSYTDPGSPALDIDMAPILGLAELPGCFPHGMTEEQAQGYAHSAKIVIAGPDKDLECEEQRLETFKGNLMQHWHKRNKSEANLPDLLQQDPLAILQKTRKDSKTGIEKSDIAEVKDLPLLPPAEVQPSDSVATSPTGDTVISPVSLQSNATANISQTSLSLQKSAQTVIQRHKANSQSRGSVHYDLHHHVQMMEVLLAEVDRLKKQAAEKERTTTAEIEELKLKLISAETRASNIEALRIENDYLESDVREKQSAIETALMRVSDLQTEERTTKQRNEKLENHVRDLQRRLEESIVQRIDLEEALYEEKQTQRTTMRLGDQLQTAELKVKELESKNKDQAEQVEGYGQLQNDYSLLLKQVEETRRATRHMKADRDRISALLQAEIRRQAMVTTRDAVETITPNLNIDQAIAEIHDRVHKALSPGITYKPAQEPAQRIAQLEQEVEFHVKDIVLYKLDVKGYRKDVRKLLSEIRHLREFRGLGNPTPSPSSTRTEESSFHGLGLSHSPMQASDLITPSATPAPSISSDESHITTPLTQSPIHRPETPLTSHKKLPRPSTGTKTPPRNPKALPLTPPMIDGKGGWKPPQVTAPADFPRQYRSITPKPLRPRNSPSRSPMRKEPPTSPSPAMRTAGDMPRSHSGRSMSESIISSYYARTPELDGEMMGERIPEKNALQQLAGRELAVEF